MSVVSDTLFTWLLGHSPPSLLLLSPSRARFQGLERVRRSPDDITTPLDPAVSKPRHSGFPGGSAASLGAQRLPWGLSGFPGGSAVKSLPTSAEDMGLHPDWEDPT